MDTIKSTPTKSQLAPEMDISQLDESTRSILLELSNQYKQEQKIIDEHKSNQSAYKLSIESICLTLPIKKIICPGLYLIRKQDNTSKLNLDRLEEECASIGYDHLKVLDLIKSCTDKIPGKEYVEVRSSEKKQTATEQKTTPS